MTELEQKFNGPSIILTDFELVKLVKQLQADRDAWIVNAKNWEKENKFLEKFLQKLAEWEDFNLEAHRTHFKAQPNS